MPAVEQPELMPATRAAKAQGERTRARLIEAIKQYERAHDGMAPTFREVSELSGVGSTGAVSYHLEFLRQQGKIVRTPHGHARSAGDSLRTALTAMVNNSDAAIQNDCIPVSRLRMILDETTR